MKLLLLAGTSQARRLAEQLVTEARIDVIASLSGATREPATLPVPMRVGGFGGDKDQEGYIVINGFDAVVDATHPFASRISHRTYDICRRLNVPYLQLLRPGWSAGAGDDWTWVESGLEAAAHIPPGSVVFLATGRQTLHEFRNLPGRHLICRQIDPPEGAFPFENGEYLVGRPPFSVEDEIALFRARAVTWLVVKNAGGDLSRTKLDAARALGIPVLMINRPEQPAGEKAATVAAAMQWIRARL